MSYFIEVDGANVIALYRDDYGFVPDGAIAVTDEEGERVSHLSNYDDVAYVSGALQVGIGSDKLKKIAEIDAAYNAEIAVISASYPETERNSWAKQEAEARSWTADNNAPTPLLTAISTARGTTIADICSRVITNADAYAVYAGATIGKRQAKMIAIEAATTLQELEAITW